MNTRILIDKLKAKLSEPENVIENTLNNQKNVLNTSQVVNKTIRDFIEEDINEKNNFRGINEKIIKLKQRIEGIKGNLKLAKEKLKLIKTVINQNNK